MKNQRSFYIHLYTAEYLYIYNFDSIIDFAPIAIEYSKVIEYQLNCIDKSRKMYEKEKTLCTIL